ncbi:MAG: response regulator [Hungateiclostridium thermocellum]|nr:response regulator [Acetivibrio thermocellus]
MFGVLIVDDEVLSRMELRNMLDWEKEGYHLIGEAENGKDGLDIILREKPDIVITDIKMPVMDGLQMIEQARKQYNGAHYIVLSSYEEFSLLKTAMKYGVIDYLLKLELTSDVLLKTLESTKEALLRDRAEARNREISPVSKAACALRSVLAGQTVDEEIVGILSQVNPAIDPNRLSCIAVRFSLPKKNSSFGDHDRRIMEMSAHSIINDITKQHGAGVSFLADIGMCLFIYTPRDDSIVSTEKMSEVIINMLRQYLNMASVVGISKSIVEAGNILTIMNEAICATEEVFFQGYGKVICYGESSATGLPDVEWSEPLLRALELRQSDKLREVFEVILGMISEPERPTRAEAVGLCISVVSIILSTLKNRFEGKSFFSEDLYKTIGEIETLDELRQWMRSFQSEVLELINSLQERSADDYIVIEAKRYIAENCRKPISLSTVANHLSISPGYLSSLFKRKTNVGFIEYVTNMKIEESKKLLRCGKYMIYEVADLVGYEDASYFIKTFRKVTGLTPKEYIAKHA